MKKVECHAYTWEKDSNGLFDYQSTHLIKTALALAPHQSLGFDPAHRPAQADKHSSWATFALNPQLTLELNPAFQLPTYYVIDDENFMAEEGGYAIREGDELRIGKLKARVRRCRGQQQEVSVATGAMPDSEEMCRFCYSCEQTPKNFMVHPCACKDPVHLACIRNWIDMTVKDFRRGRVITLEENALVCNVCKAPILQTIPLDGERTVDLFSYDGPYAILDLVSSFRVLRTFVVTGLQEKESVVAGRMADCDIYLPDISVSRVHSELRMAGGRLILSDKRSKFGTLLLLKDRVLLPPTCSKLQVGRTLLIINQQ